MDPDRWRQIDALLLASLERPLDERVRFIEAASGGDENLKSEVLSLLSSDGRLLSLIEKPAFEGAIDLLATHIPELNPCQSIGHYRVISFLGAGGMGEVYIAEDTKLDRKVAIKLLSAENNLGGKQLNLLDREARAASALNHPNIITIYEIGEFEGRNFIATEFIEGETLRQRLNRQKVSVREVADIAIQVASALSVAHGAGIVHRDIKPENIMLRADGYVKVLDFGLAKLSEPDTPVSDDKSNRVETDSIPGLLMGTVRYMSPEQARGLRLDARTDIFSLGVVLYEMIAGRPPFEGETNSDLIASILKTEPSSLSDCLHGTSAELQSIVSRALIKDRDGRYQSAKEMLAVLKDLGWRLEASSKSGGATTISSSDAPGGLTSLSTLTRLLWSPKRRWSPAAFITAGLALVAISLFALLKVGGVGKKVGNFENVTIQKITSNGSSRDAAISPDGKYVAYVVEEPEHQTIWIKQIATDDTARLVPPSVERLSALTFSQDSNHLFYVRYEKDGVAHALYEISILGGPAERIIAQVDSPISFSPDGKEFAFFRRYQERNALLVANSDGTEEREIKSGTSADRLCDYPCGPAWSPDGKVIAYASDHYAGNASITTLVELNASGGSERIISTEKNWSFLGLTWIPDGTGLVVTASIPSSRPTQLWHLSYPWGELLPFTNDLSSYVGASIASSSSAIACTQKNWTETIWTSDAGDPTRARLVNSSRTKYGGLGLAPDGRIVYSQSSRNGSEIWIMNEDGSDRKQLTFSGFSGDQTTLTPFFSAYPSVSPDGKYIIYLSNRPDSNGIWRMDLDGRNPTLLVKVNSEPYSRCSADSRWVVFHDGGWWKVSISGGDPIPLNFSDLRQKTRDIYMNDTRAISPDGRLIAYTYEDAQADPPRGIAIIPFEGEKVIKRFPLLTESAGEFDDRIPQVSWSADGQALIYPGSNLWSQPIDGSPARQLTNFQGEHVVWYDTSRDGKKLACIRQAETMDAVLITRRR